MGLRGDMGSTASIPPKARERQRASVGEHYQMIELAVSGETEAIAPLITKHILDVEAIVQGGAGEIRGRDRLRRVGRLLFRNASAASPTRSESRRDYNGTIFSMEFTPWQPLAPSSLHARAPRPPA